MDYIGDAGYIYIYIYWGLLINKPPPSKGLNIRMSILIPVEEGGL